MLRRLALLSAVLVVVCGCADKTPMSLTQQALHELRSGKYDAAIATAGNAIHADPKSAENYLYRGRAYHYRNAMGDHNRAIADFGKAILLAPDSSDAYYSRALAYRDLGEVKLADADEQKARELDNMLHDVYKRLPEEMPPMEIAKTQAEEEAARLEGSANSSDADQRKLYEKLKKQYEPGFGSIRTPKRTADVEAADKLHEERKERIRSLIAGPSYTLPSYSDPQEGEQGGIDGIDVLGGVDVGKPLADESKKNAGMPGGVGPPKTARPLTIPEPKRRQRGTTAMIPAAGRNSVRSPFPQSAPAPTGYVEPPANPFAPPSRPATGTSPSTVSRPFNGPAAGNPFSNPSVRPMNPRDYVP